MGPKDETVEIARGRPSAGGLDQADGGSLAGVRSSHDGRGAPRGTRSFNPALKAIFVGGTLVIIAGLGGLFFFRPVAVTVAAVTTRDTAPAIQGVGTVEAKVAVNVSSKITGRVVSVSVDQGDTIKAGHLIARLDDAQYLVDVDRGEASVPPAAAR